MAEDKERIAELEQQLAEARAEGMREAAGIAENYQGIHIMERDLCHGIATLILRAAEAQKEVPTEPATGLAATGATSAESASAGVAQDDTTRPCPAGKHLVFVWPSGKIAPHFAADGKKCEASYRMYADV